MGRKPSIDLNEETLEDIRRLARMHATHDEIAAWLEVARSTWMKFKRDHPEAQHAFDDGMNQGKISLRRKQFKLAEKNAAMAIFLGKQYLGQRDIIHHRDAELEHLSDEEIIAEIIEAMREIEPEKLLHALAELGIGPVNPGQARLAPPAPAGRGDREDPSGEGGG